MSSFWLNLLWTVVGKLVGGDFFEICKALVLAAANTDYVDRLNLTANEQRKLAVKAQLKALQNELGEQAKSMGGWLLSLAVDAAVGKLKAIGLLK